MLCTLESQYQFDLRQSRNMHLIRSSFPTSDAYLSPKEQKGLGESHFVMTFDCECPHTYTSD